MRSSRVHFRSIGVLCLVLALSAASPTDSPLADAARRGDVDVVRSLLRGGSDVNASEGDGMTALHWAAETGRTEIAEILIYAGANLEAVTRLGDYTPMHLAGRNGEVEVLRVLLAAGADANAVTRARAFQFINLDETGARLAGGSRTAAHALLRNALREARDRGFRAMQFNFVISSNLRAVALWERAGFKIVGRLPGAFNHPKEGYVDALVMHKPLGAA